MTLGFFMRGQLELGHAFRTLVPSSIHKHYCPVVVVRLGSLGRCAAGYLGRRYTVHGAGPAQIAMPNT